MNPDNRRRYIRFKPDLDITLQVMELAELAKQGVRILIYDLKSKRP